MRSILAYDRDKPWDLETISPRPSPSQKSKAKIPKKSTMSGYLLLF